MRGETGAVPDRHMQTAETVVPVLVGEVSTEGGVQQGADLGEFGGVEIGGVGEAEPDGHDHPCGTRPSTRAGNWKRAGKPARGVRLSGPSFGRAGGQPMCGYV
ncbi:hypothetical protein GCM10023100_23600 [Actinocorallia cavernae]|uniref:Uncharacterized protein n=2 Tax=Actinomycetes TaxID=1760 RepID=A0ABN3LZM6_9ACTN